MEAVPCVGELGAQQQAQAMVIAEQTRQAVDADAWAREEQRIAKGAPRLIEHADMRVSHAPAMAAMCVR